MLGWVMASFGSGMQWMRGWNEASRITAARTHAPSLPRSAAWAKKFVKDSTDDTLSCSNKLESYEYRIGRRSEQVLAR